MVHVSGRLVRSRRFRIDRKTVSKMLAFSVPPGYRRARPPAGPKLDPFTGIIDRILAAETGYTRTQTPLGVGGRSRPVIPNLDDNDLFHRALPLAR